MVDDTTLCSIRNLVEYIEDTKDRNPIVNDAKRVRNWLDGESDMPNEAHLEICPKCGKRALEICGEGISSLTGEHYPLEHCHECRAVPANRDKNEVIEISFGDNMHISYTDEEDTKEVIINHKKFHFEVDSNPDYDLCGIKSVHLTEYGDPNEIEMLEAYDLYKKE